MGVRAVGEAEAMQQSNSGSSGDENSASIRIVFAAFYTLGVLAFAGATGTVISRWYWQRSTEKDILSGQPPTDAHALLGDQWIITPVPEYMKFFFVLFVLSFLLYASLGCTLMIRGLLTPDSTRDDETPQYSPGDEWEQKNL